MTKILEAKNLKVIRGGSLLVDIPGMEIFEGETLSLIGPNGAGKTTLLQALSYLMKPSAGQILFRGQAVGAAQPKLEYRRRLAMVIQEPLLAALPCSANRRVAVLGPIPGTPGRLSLGSPISAL